MVRYSKTCKGLETFRKTLARASKSKKLSNWFLTFNHKASQSFRP